VISAMGQLTKSNHTGPEIVLAKNLRVTRVCPIARGEHELAWAGP
jgi:hypothetical protein